MAERPDGFARRMMAQKLMTEARSAPFSDSAGFGGRSTPADLLRSGAYLSPDDAGFRSDSAGRSRFDIDGVDAVRASGLGNVLYGAAATGSLFAPGAGIADVMGYAPDPMQAGEMLPSFGENVRQGNYLDAGLQTLGVAGDVFQAGGAIVPPLAAVGTALKTPRAARVADAAMDAARLDPNQAAGAAMEAAQARYFETGKFEPPTAENPVSIVPPTPDEPGIIAFHGSGADFDEFRLEMIGTGEGAQAYGYGLYFTDSEDIAKFYRDSIGRGRSSIVYDGSSVKNAREVDGLTDREFVLDNIATEMAFFDQKPANVIESKIRSLKARIDDPVDISPYADDAEAQELADLIRQSAQRELEIYESLDPDKFTRGKMYKVALAPKPDELLDYDKSLRQQPKFADALKPLYEEYGVAETADIGTLFESIKNQRGIPPQSLSERLSAAGIPGIKYRASGSRGATTADEAAERNYVIFDDKAVNILEKYGIVGPVLVTGAVVGASKASNDNEDGGSILPNVEMM